MKHKLKNMVIKKSTDVCYEPGCNTYRPYFNYKNNFNKKTNYCNKHRKVGMIHRQLACIFNNCLTRASYRKNVIGSKRI